MSEERKPRSVWPWIAALLIGLPVLYVASFGPACWLSSRLGHGAGILPVIYRPIVRNMEHSKPNWSSYSSPGAKLPSVGDTMYHSSRGGVISWYAGLLAAEGWQWYCVEQYQVNDLDPGDKWEWRSFR